METIVSAVKSTQSIEVSENIKAVCKAIIDLKANGKENDVKTFLETVNFESAFEKLVAVKLIDAFKLKDNLISAFSTEDLFVISQSLKCDWFFEEDYGLFSDKNLVVNFFSKLSFSGRCKVIKKYSKTLKNKEQAESLFGLLEEMFGIGTALVLLPACSEFFITDILYSKNVVLPDRVLQQLYFKYPDFTVDFIFSYYEKKNNNNSRHNYSETYERTLLMIASDKTAWFIEFYNKYGSSVHLDKFGRSLTHKILKLGYASVLRNIKSYLDILHLKHIVSYLSRAQIEEIHFCLLSKTLSQFNELNFYSYCTDIQIEILNTLKKPIAEEILLKNFRKKYGKEPTEVDIDENWYKYFPAEISAKLVENKLKTNKDLEDYKAAGLYMYLPFNEAFDKLKSLVPTALDTSARIRIVDCMVCSARFHRSSAGASQIISFVVSRFRNDNPQVQGGPLDGLVDGFDLTKLTVEQWAPVIELFNILTINNDLDQFSTTLVTLYEKWVQCRLKAGLPIDSEMELIMKYFGYRCDFNIACGTQYERVCLNWFNDNLLKKSFANDREKFNYAIRLFCCINEFNVLHPDQAIAQKDWVMDIVKDKMEETYSRSEIMVTLKKNKALKFKIYDAIFPKVIFPEILTYKLKHSNIDIVNNVEAIILKVMSASQVSPFKQFFQRLLFCTDLLNKFTENCLKLVESENEDNPTRYKENAIFILSFLNHSAFFSLIKEFYPTGPKADCEGSEAYEKYRLQTVIASSLKNINPPYRSLEAVQKYSIGDYLKLVLGSVLSVALKISQTRALEFLKANLNSPISFRKHIIRVFRLVASKTAVNDLLLSSLKEENNISLRIILFNSILDMMKSEKSSLSWETVKQSFAILSDKDLKQLTSRIFNLGEIPSEFQGEYVETVWALLLRLDVSYDNKVKIFSLIDNNTITFISDDFANLLLGMTYCGDSSNQHTWNSFISLYLNYSKVENLDKRLFNVMELVKNKVCVSIDNNLDSTKDFSSLMTTIFDGSLADNVTINPSNLLSELKTRLLQMFAEHQIHQVIFSLSLCQIYIKNNKCDNLLGFADDVCGLVDLHCSTYGSCIIEIISSHIEHFLCSNFNQNKPPQLVFSHRILTGPTSPLNKIIAIKILPKETDPEMDSELKMYNAVIDTIKSSPDHSLKIFARHCLYDL